MRNTKKAISLRKLIISRLFLYIVLALTAILLLSFILDAMYLNYFEKRDLIEKLKINSEEYQKVSPDYLKKHKATIEIVDSNLKVISSKGAENLTGHQYTPIEFATLLQNNSDYRNVGYKTIESDYGKDYTIVLIQTITKKALRNYNLVNDYYTIGLLTGTLLLLVVVFIFFVRSVYKPVRESFKAIEKNIVRTPYDKTKADLSHIPLSESQNVLKCYNEMLDEMEQMKKEKDAAIDQSNKLISNLSHDLKSPITTIIGYSEILVEDNLKPDDQKKYLTYIRQSASDLNELVLLLFQQVKYQSSDYSINFEPIDINSFLRDLCANYYMLFDKRGFQMEVQIEEVPHRMNVDKVHMKRALSNLFENCLSHNPVPAKVRIATQKTDTHFTIYFMDDGVGIKEEDRSNIFEPFFQCDDSRSNKHSGLGLYVTRQIIEKHYGRISVTGDPEYKTVFEIQFDC